MRLSKISTSVRIMAALSAAALLLARAVARRLDQRPVEPQQLGRSGDLPVLVRSEEDHPWPDRRVRWQQLAAGHHGVGQGRDRQVPERHRASPTPTARATPRRPSPTSRAWSPRASTRSSSSPTPASRAARPAQRVPGRRVTVSLPRRPGRHGRQGLQRLGRRRLHHRRQELGELDPQEPAQRRQRPVPVRPRRQQPGHRRGQGAALGPRPDRQVHTSSASSRSSRRTGIPR